MLLFLLILLLLTYLKIIMIIIIIVQFLYTMPKSAPRPIFATSIPPSELFKGNRTLT